MCFTLCLYGLGRKDVRTVEVWLVAFCLNFGRTEFAVTFSRLIKDKQIKYCIWSFLPRLVTPQAMLPYACGVTRREGATPMQAKWIKLDIVIMHRYTFWDSCHGGVRKERRKLYAMYVMYGRFGRPVLIGGVQSSVHFDFIHWNIGLFYFNKSANVHLSI